MSELMNPIKAVRLERQWTQEEFAQMSAVTRHAVLRTEQGVYALPPPAILSCISQRTTHSIERLEHEYKEWVKVHRRRSGIEYGDRYYERGSDYSSGKPTQNKLAHTAMNGPQFLAWRRELGIQSRMEFCRAFCVHPAVVEKYEKGQQHKMPDQLREALFDAGLLGTDY